MNAGPWMSRQQRRSQQRSAQKKRLAVVPEVEHDGYGVVAGWCATGEDLEEAKKGTHDSLIALMGDGRTGRVQWRIHSGTEAVEALSVLHRGGASPEIHDHYRRIAALLREYGGFLVVALAPGTTLKEAARRGP